MNRFIVMAVAVVLLAAGAAARAAEKEAPIDWPARAATVKVGMTRAEVEKILPKWESPNEYDFIVPGVKMSGALFFGGSGSNSIGWDEYHVAEDWYVFANYVSNDGQQTIRLTQLRIKKISRSPDETKMWQAKAASIKVGMTRVEAERNLPAWGIHDEGHWAKNTPTTHEIYGFEADWSGRFHRSGFSWSVTIDYDQTGGVWNEKNRVIKPAMVETFEKPVLLLEKPKPTP